LIAAASNVFLTSEARYFSLISTLVRRFFAI